MTTPSRSPATLPYKIGFIGAGQMALALAKGFMASGLLAPSQVCFLAAK
jgi:pyrroline-5-carboxylate reductase